MPNMTPEQVKQIIDNQIMGGPLEAGQGMTPLGGASIGAKPGVLSGLKKGAKRFGPEIIGWLLLSKYLSNRHKSKLQDIQMEAMQGQAEMATPENLYYQASLPQAKAEEEMARNALLGQLSGGVIGPTLARGERFIGS